MLGHWVAAVSTLGTFLRAFTWGHVRQLDAQWRHSILAGYFASRRWRVEGLPQGVS